MIFLKITQLKHSGQGENAIHKRVMNEFRKSEHNGVLYCKNRGWNVHIYPSSSMDHNAGPYIAHK